MNEWFKKTFGTAKDKWGKWTVVQKGIVIGIAAVVVAALVLLLSLSSRQTTVRLFNSPVTDEHTRDAIVTRLDQDNVRAYVSADGYISVDSEAIARKYRSKLIAEGYEPSDKDPWSLFDEAKWSRTSFDDEVNWKRAMQESVEKHIMQLDGIRKANVTLSLPKDALFQSDQHQPTASVILFAKQGSDVLSSKRQVQGIERLIMRSVEGLTAENITILNGDTNEELNDFEGMAESDRISNIDKQLKLVRKQESEYSAAVLKALQATFNPSRVRIVNMTIDMDMSEKTSTATEYSGITLKPDNPDTPYDDSEVVQSLVISEEVVQKDFTGTGFNPEGPAGVMGQNPPVYSDSSNLIGKSEENGYKKNYVVNSRTTTENVSPQKGRRTVSVNIDSSYVYPLYDENGKVRFDEDGLLARRQIDLSEEQKQQVTRLVQSAIGYDAQRGDRVDVTNIPFDHFEEWQDATNKYLKAQRTRQTVVLALIGVAVVLLAFIIFRFISREMERRRRLREEERLRQQQAEREQALWDAKEQGMEVTMSVEERKRAELQESAIAMAKEHPEDVAMLIRTWLMEE